MAQAFRSGFVSIVGRPNAGKSTLLNRLIGEKLAIIAPQAQTTRTTIQGVLTTGEAQIAFLDTPGIHKSNTLMNKRMMDTVRSSLVDRDLVLFVADASRAIGEEEQHAVSALARSSKSLLVLNKIDRITDKRLLLPTIEHYGRLFPFAESVPASARTGEGVDRLLRAIVEALPVGEPHFPSDYLTDQPMRFIAAEIVREQVLRNTREEVPHAVAVSVELWEDKANLTRIAATIFVERSGQRVILLGSKGAMLKKIGTASREELEGRLERKVFLQLFVKVKPGWRDDPAFLNTIDWRAAVGSEEQ